ncbi:MAG: transposase zinc-binding domain-containing protein [Planctomycetota bacterium]
MVGLEPAPEHLATAAHGRLDRRAALHREPSLGVEVAICRGPRAGYVEEELRGYLECGILCFGFGRALCTGCGQGLVIAFSCKGRGVCPSCNGRHMAQTVAHLVDHVIPPVPVRQWVISVPKRLRCFLANRPEAVAAHTKIFLAETERLLSAAAGVTIDAGPPQPPARGSAPSPSCTASARR